MSERELDLLYRYLKALYYAGIELELKGLSASDNEWSSWLDYYQWSVIFAFNIDFINLDAVPKMTRYIEEWTERQVRKRINEVIILTEEDWYHVAI